MPVPSCSALAIAAWDLVVRLKGIPPYILPGPGLVLASLIGDWATLWPSLLVTLQITFMALLAAVYGRPGAALSRARRVASRRAV